MDAKKYPNKVIALPVAELEKLQAAKAKLEQETGVRFSYAQAIAYFATAWAKQSA